MRIRKNDTVKVLYGKDSGKTGKVLRVLPTKDKIVVEGVNVFKRHLKGDGKKRQSEIVDLVKPMNVAKVMLVCPSCGKTTRVSFEKGERICKKCSKKINSTTEKKKEEKVEKKIAKKQVTKKKTKRKTVKK